MSIEMNLRELVREIVISVQLQSFGSADSCTIKAYQIASCIMQAN